MAIQDIKLGTQPSGAGGDTNRSANVKINENFNNKQHAASRMVGVSAGNLLEVGAFGLGAQFVSRSLRSEEDLKESINDRTEFLVSSDHVPMSNGKVLPAYAVGISIVRNASGHGGKILFTANRLFFGRSSIIEAWTESNTTIDSNGFIKKASPIVQLFATMIKPNAEAAEQKPIFKKVGNGHYLIKGTQGFATEGWWIEVPADTNGNKICAVQYQTLENGDLEIKTFKKKLNDEGDIVPNLDAPIDIPNNTNGEPRWIDIRLNPLPAKPIVEQVPRTEKRPKMVKQIKYAPQLTYITKMQDLIDDEGNPVIIKGQPFQAPVSYVHTDQNGTPILTSQPVINDNGENVFELVQEVDLDGQPVFEDVPVLDADGNQIFDEVTHGPEQ